MVPVMPFHHATPHFHSAQHDQHLLYVVFVKAFDKMRRDLMLGRCQELGIHGKFSALLVALYDRVYCRDAGNGTLRDPSRTTTCTKQVSKLSPLLFGLFIELLHDLIKLGPGHHVYGRSRTGQNMRCRISPAAASFTHGVPVVLPRLRGCEAEAVH